MNKPQRARRVLVMEDDKPIAKALAIRLRDAGYEVEVAFDGLEGLKLAVGMRPDLICSDIWMPGSVGFLVAERLKCFGLSDVPIVFITASKDANMRRLAEEAGSAGFLEKPFDSKELLVTCARALAANPPSVSRPRSIT